MASKEMTRRQFERRLSMVDLEPIKYALVKSKDGPQWTGRQAVTTEIWYRRFHTLIWLYPNQTIVPTKHIDEFWHNHILDTEKYFQDCISLHGKFVHHFPYLGTDDKATLLTLYQSTLRLFLDTFNESPVVLNETFVSRNSQAKASMCGVTTASLCGAGCANVRPSLNTSVIHKRKSPD